MKKAFIFIITLAMILTGCRIKEPVTGVKQETNMPQETNQAINYHDQTTWVLGYFTCEQISRYPHSEWFLKGYADYQFNQDIVNKLTEINKDNITIKVVMGSWCPDSRREVPRFMRIIDEWKFPMEKITFIGVDDAKLSPVGEYDKLNIERVPTFIFYRNNIELGRIIENPATSLEQDMLNILTRNE